MQIIKVNEKRLTQRDSFQSQINDREAAAVEIKLLMEQIKISNA